MLVELSGKVGDHKLKRRQVAIDLENDAEGPLPGLPSRLRGKTIGSDVEVDYKLPTEGVPPEMAGGQVHLHVTIKEAREKKVPALDDEMAKDTGEAETLEGLRAKVRDKLLEADQQRIKGEVTRALVKELVKRNEFPVAPALIDRYAQLIVNRAKQQLQMMGVDVEGVDDEKMRAEMRAEAEEEARGSILVQAIAEREGITVTDADLQKRIAELAVSRNENPKQLRAELEKDNRIHQLEDQIREQKTLDMLIAQAKITDEEAPSLIVTPEQAKREAKQRAQEKRQKGTETMSDSIPRPRFATSSSRRSSSRPTAASAAGTSSPGCSRTASSSWAPRRRRGRQPHHRPDAVPRERGSRTRTSCSTSTRRAAGDGRAWRSTTPCSTCAATWRPSAWARRRRWARSCSRRAPRASASRCRTRAS